MFGDRQQNFRKRYVLPAKNIALAGTPALQRSKMAGRDIVNMHHVEPGLDESRHAAGRMPAFVETGLNMVHVDDVAAGHLAALERGRTGERYILGGQNVSLSEILLTVAEHVGRRPPRLKIPRGVVFPVAVVAEAVARRTGREPFVTVNGLRMSKNRMFFTAAKAEKELGYRARPYAEGIRDAIEWFREAGRL